MMAPQSHPQSFTRNTNPTSINELHIRTNAFLNETTSFLSTIPSPIEGLDELLSIAALTNALIQVLRDTAQIFELKFSENDSFLRCLVEDNVFALGQVGGVVRHARRSGVWESQSGNGVNVLGVGGMGGREGWVKACGSEEHARRLRSRFFVEKYRVRVLIDAVSWWALRGKGLEGRSEGEEREFRELEGRLPVIVERLGGVWRDYVVRLRRGESGAPLRYQASMASSSTQGLGVGFNPINNSCGLCPANSTSSQDKETTRYETYLLRRNPATKHLETSTSILGLPLFSTYTHTPPTHYIKPLPCPPSLLSSYLATSLQTYSPPSPFPFPFSSTFPAFSPPNREETHLLNLRKKILSMPEDAQREIQKLLECRESTSSSRGTRTEWEICGVVERPRRRINHASVKRGRSWFSSLPSLNRNRVAKTAGRWREGRDKRDPVEYILVVRSKALLASSSTSASASASRVPPLSNGEEMRRLQQKQLEGMRNQAHALRQREQQGLKIEKGMSIEEAERRMLFMCRDLFQLENQGEGCGEGGDEEMESDTDDEIEDEDDEDVVEDEEDSDKTLV